MNLVDALQSAIDEWQKTTQASIEASGRAAAPRSPLTTVHFADTIFSRGKASATTRTVELFSLSTKPKPFWTWEGYTIRAKRAPNLIFITYDGQWHSRKAVFHPPNRWRDKLMVEVELEARTLLSELVTAKLNEAMKK